MGHFALAEQTLRESMGRLLPRVKNFATASQARSVQAGLYTALCEYDKARCIAEDLIVEYSERRDRRGVAVALTRLGLVEKAIGVFPAAAERLHNAVEAFRECDDMRGLAWSLSSLAACKIELGNRAGRRKDLIEAMGIYADIGACDADYAELLRYVLAHATDIRFVQSLNAELDRIASASDWTAPARG